MNRLWKIVLAGAASAPLLFSGIAAEAHAHVIKSMPAANAAGPAPKVIHLDFNERLAAKFSGVELMKADGSNVPVTVKVGSKFADATPKAALSRGQYMVMWHAVADDGHKSKGQYNFTVK